MTEGNFDLEGKSRSELTQMLFEEMDNWEAMHGELASSIERINMMRSMLASQGVNLQFEAFDAASSSAPVMSVQTITPALPVEEMPVDNRSVAQISQEAKAQEVSEMQVDASQFTASLEKSMGAAIAAGFEVANGMAQGNQSVRVQTRGFSG